MGNFCEALPEQHIITVSPHSCFNCGGIIHCELWCGKYLRNIEIYLDSHLLSARGQAEFIRRGDTMQYCSSLLICHICHHHYGSIENDDSDSPEGINEGNEEILPSKDTENDSSGELVPPYSLQIQWDRLEKFETEELMASNFCSRDIAMGKAWPFTLAVVTIDVHDIENGERNYVALLFMLLYFYIMMKA